MTYNYYETVKNDIYEIIDEEKGYLKQKMESFMFYEDAKSWIKDYMCLDDSVTGNASGSYTCSRWEAEENLLHNRDLIMEAIEADFLPNELTLEPEIIDVGVRCFMVWQIIDYKWNRICEHIGVDVSIWE